jgi:CO/xanthine dehydrogenase Mo-binding subunit
MSRLREDVNRRSVLKAGALVVAFSLAGAKLVSARDLVRDGPVRDGADEDAPTAKAIGGFVRIDATGRIVLVMPSVEMGQGIYTAEAVLLAEELDVGLDQVDLVAAPPDASLYAQPLFKAQMTGGSTSIRGFWTPLRQAGATARAMLVAAAARWSVAPETCSTDRATVRHEASSRNLSYGEFAGDAASGPTPANAPLKGAGRWKLIGTGDGQRGVARCAHRQRPRGNQSCAGDHGRDDGRFTNWRHSHAGLCRLTLRYRDRSDIQLCHRTFRWKDRECHRG